MRIMLATTILLASAAQAEIPTPPRPVTDPKTLTSPVNADARAVPLGDFEVNRNVTEAIWSADGKDVFLVTNISGRFNIWKVAADGGWPIQLTQSNDLQAQIAASPDGRSIAFAQDKGGDEIHDLMAVSKNGGPVTKLTDTPDIDERNPHYSPDGKILAFDSKPRESSNVNVAVLDLKSGKVTEITRETAPEFLWETIGWLPDGKFVIANRRNVLDTLSSVWRVDISTGKAERLTPDDAALTTASGVSADGATIAITTNAGTGQLHAGLFDIRTGKARWLKPTPWEQTSGSFSPNGRTFLARTQEDGRSKLALFDTATLAERPLAIPAGRNVEASTLASSFSADGRATLVIHESADISAEIWVGRNDGEPRQLTHLAMGSLTNLPRSEIVTYRSFDGTLISGVAIMPFNLKRDGSNPAIIMPHGGPTAQAEDYFTSTSSALASRGYIVIRPNFRGSTGYGKAFQAANIRDLGGGDLRDVLAAKDFLVASGYVDPKKVGITGGSYGGFMSLMAIGKTPGAFAAAVQICGIINWYTMEKTSDPLLKEYLYGLIGRPDTEKALYDASSPLTYIKAAKAPLLSLQGENDIRVPRGQAQEVNDALKAKGNIVETVFYPEEGHGFRKRENQADALRRTIEWFDRYLKPGGKPATP